MGAAQAAGAERVCPQRAPPMQGWQPREPAGGPQILGCLVQVGNGIELEAVGLQFAGGPQILGG